MKEKRLVKGVNKRWSLMGEIFLVCVGFDIQLVRHKEASRLQTQPHVCVCVIVCACVSQVCAIRQPAVNYDRPRKQSRS